MKWDFDHANTQLHMLDCIARYNCENIFTFIRELLGTYTFSRYKSLHMRAGSVFEITYIIFATIDEIISKACDNDLTAVRKIIKENTSLLLNNIDEQNEINQKDIHKFVFIIIWALSPYLSFRLEKQCREQLFRHKCLPTEELYTPILAKIPNIQITANNYVRAVKNQNWGLAKACLSYIKRTSNGNAYNFTKNFIHTNTLINQLDYVPKKDIEVIERFIAELLTNHEAIALLNQKMSTLKALNQPNYGNTPQYSTYLKRNINIGKTLDEIQANLVNAAKNGAAALVDYINSNEGQIYLDFRKERKIQIINTLNRELATNIKPQTFRIALNRKGIKNPTL